MILSNKVKSGFNTSGIVPFDCLAGCGGFGPVKLASSKGRHLKSFL